MGTDNLHHKRKAKRANDLQRRGARRAPYAKVLIVTEGSSTEPAYFRELKDYYKLNSANVVINGSGNSSPIGVVNFGQQLYRQELDKGDEFDRVYCVFDKNSHASYPQALNKIRSLAPKGVYFAINSIPCFEYWLLLHFAYTTAPFAAAGNISAAMAVIDALKEHMPDYRKSAKGVFTSLLGQLETAKSNAARALKSAAAHGTDNPSTRVHELVEFLQAIKAR